MRFRFLEEFCFFTDDFREEEVGEAGGAETKPLVGQPLFAEHFLDDGVVDQGIVNGVQTTGSLKPIWMPVLS